MEIRVTASAGSNQAPIITKRIEWLQDEFPDPKDQRDYARNRCVVAITEAIGGAMEQANLNRAAIAHALGVSRSQVTKWLGGAHNMTLHTLADLLWACRAEVRDLQLMELGVIEVLADRSSDWVRQRNVAPIEEAATTITPPPAIEETV